MLKEDALDLESTDTSAGDRSPPIISQSIENARTITGKWHGLSINTSVDYQFGSRP